MANEYIGFSGTSVQMREVLLDLPQNSLGFKGTSVQISDKQYLETQFGFKGTSVVIENSGYALKVQHFK